MCHHIRGSNRKLFTDVITCVVVVIQQLLLLIKCTCNVADTLHGLTHQSPNATIMGARALRPQETLRHHLGTSAPSLSRITGGAVSRRNCPGTEVSRARIVPTFPRSNAQVKTLRHRVSRFWCRSVLRHPEVSRDTLAPVPKCLVAEVSGNRSY